MNDSPRDDSPDWSWLVVVWPAFLAACLLEALVFGLVDPDELLWPGSFFHPPRQSVYTVAFFMFWLIGSACCSLTLWLSRPQRKLSGTAAD